jgi:signal peptidase I
MSSSEHAAQSSPWISVWLKPRTTIQNILAERPQRNVLVLGSLSLMAGTLVQLLGYAVHYRLFDWRVIIGSAIACAIAGIVGLYISAFLFKWSGRLFGGRATAAEVRTVVAWGLVPSLLGLAIALVLVAVASVTTAGDDVAPLWVLISLRAIVLICGIWSAVVFALMFSRAEKFGFWRTVLACLVGWILSVTLSLLIASGIRTLLLQPFSTPSHSMSPTLLIGDYFFVSKFAYGYTHFSIPFSPHWFSGRIFGSEPARGDVVVFRIPKDDNVDYIKRVIGLPGDRIQVKQGALYINDTAVKREQVADFVGGDSCGEDAAAKVKRWRETLPNGVSYEVLDCVENGFFDNTKTFEVPAGQFFVLGDNRDNSTDSRVASFGTIPFDRLIGRAAFIYFSAVPAADGAPSTARAERIGQVIH